MPELDQQVRSADVSVADIPVAGISGLGATEPGLRIPRIRLALAWAVTADLMAMMVLTFVDVVGRYIFASPLPGAKELTEILMGFLVFAAAPLVTADRGHITTALFESVLPKLVIRWRNVLIAVLVAIARAVLAWRLWIQAGLVLELKTGTPLLGVPIAPIVYFASVTSALCVLIVLALEFRALLLAMRGDAR